MAPARRPIQALAELLAASTVLQTFQRFCVRAVLPILSSARAAPGHGTLCACCSPLAGSPTERLRKCHTGAAWSATRVSQCAVGPAAAGAQRPLPAFRRRHPRWLPPTLWPSSSASWRRRRSSRPTSRQVSKAGCCSCAHARTDDCRHQHSLLTPPHTCCPCPSLQVEVFHVNEPCGALVLHVQPRAQAVGPEVAVFSGSSSQHADTTRVSVGTSSVRTADVGGGRGGLCGEPD